MIEGSLLLLILVLFVHLFRSVDLSMRGARKNLLGLFSFREQLPHDPESKKQSRKRHA